MINRKYFFSVKVAHNNGTGNYTWWHDFTSYRSLTPNPELVMKQIRSDCKAMLSDEVPYRFCGDDVEFVAFNKV